MKIRDKEDIEDENDLGNASTSKDESTAVNDTVDTTGKKGATPGD